MTKPTIRIHNAQTNEIIDREMTNEEHAAWLDQKVIDDEKAALLAEIEISKSALLAKLGITADEAKLLLS
jgi:hypothetical protein